MTNSATRGLEVTPRETGAELPEITWSTRTAVDHADDTRLRGLPAIGRNCPGRVSGSDPVVELLRAESRRRA